VSVGTLRRASAFSVGNSVLLTLASMVSGVVIARTLGAEGKGEVYFARQFSVLSATVITLGLPAAVVYFMRQGKLRISEACTLAVVMCCAAGCALWLAYRFLPAAILMGSGWDGHSVVLIYALTLAQVVGLFSLHIVLGLPDGVVRVSVFKTVGTSGYLALLVWYCVWREASSYGVLILLLVTSLVPTFFALAYIVRRSAGDCVRITVPLALQMLEYGLLMFMSNLMLSSLLRIDTFLINGVLGSEALGRYSAAVAIGELLLVVPSAVGTAHFPHLAGAAGPTRIESASRIFRMTIFCGVVGTGLLFMLGYPALLAFGRDFTQAVPTLYLLLPGIAAMAAAYPLVNFFNASGMPKVTVICFGAMAIGNVLLNLVLLSPFGIAGASISSSVTYIIAAGVLVSVYRRRTGQSARDLFWARRSDFDFLRTSGTGRNEGGPQ
jgi:O-antigen/teichoic acid export membrane protein